LEIRETIPAKKDDRMIIRNYATEDYEQIKQNQIAADMFDPVWDSPANFECLTSLNASTEHAFRYSWKAING